MRYHGGKWRAAPYIISHFPLHMTYCEPFGGGASVLLRKPRAKNEIYNDLDGDIVNVFRVLRDQKKAQELLRLLEMTPFARDEMLIAWEDTDNDIEQARRTLVRSHMGFGSAGATKGRTGFRGLDCYEGSYSAPADQWKRLPESIMQIIDRLKGVILENRNALSIIEGADNASTLFYLDPPYVMNTRSSMKGGLKYYRYEMSDEDHEQLCNEITKLKGMTVLSGYMNDIYMDILKDWRLVRYPSRAGSNKGTVIREECLWISPNCQARDKNLFSEI